MYKHWIGCHWSNFSAGRAGLRPEAIVLHRSASSIAAVDARCAKVSGYNSPHYGIDIGGEVHQYVEEKDTAFHAGIVVNPTWKLVKPGRNPNFYTIGIELAGTTGETISAGQSGSLAELITEIASRWKFTPDAEHIVLHDEIRAGGSCPGPSFDRGKILAAIATQRPAATSALGPEESVIVLKDAAIRVQPASSARTVRVSPANNQEIVLSFADSGERIAGNSTWYQTGDGNFLWAGFTDKPNPVSSLATPVFSVSASPPAVPAACGIHSLDNLLKQSPGPGISEGMDAAGIGAVQDLLTGHEYAGLPGLLSSNYGTWTPKTTAAVQAFQSRCSLPATGAVDRQALEKMIEQPATDARATHAYLTLVLQYSFTGIYKVLSLVSQMEGAGKFAAFNRNTDRAGASFGLIQWAQKPGRLAEILRAMCAADREHFVAIFGSGDPLVADGLLDHCRKPSGGVNPKTGEAANPTYDLIREPWSTRFRQAAMFLPFQKVQVQTAIEAFTKSASSIRNYAPDLRSERAMGFMLDIANQFGDGGAKALYTRIHKDGMKEPDVLDAVADASVTAMDDSLKTGVRSRRDRFLETTFLSANDPFGL